MNHLKAIRLCEYDVEKIAFSAPTAMNAMIHAAREEPEPVETQMSVY